MGIHTYGTNAVDWEQRLDLDRLRIERLAKLQAELNRSSLGAILAFDFPNIRYMTATHIGTWANDHRGRSRGGQGSSGRLGRDHCRARSDGASGARGGRAARGARDQL